MAGVLSSKIDAISHGARFHGDETSISRTKMADDEIFKTFLKKSSVKSVWMKDCLLRSLEGWNGCVMRTLNIGGANIAFPVSFYDASILFLQTDSLPFALGRAFRNASDMLNAYLLSHSDNPFIPESSEHRDALRNLLQFLERLDDVSTVLVENLPDWELMLLLVQHVLSQLSPYPSYKLDDTKFDSPVCCPCNNIQETLYGVREDTSFGWEDGWHGRLDILMADVPVNVPIYMSDNFSSEIDEAPFCSEHQSSLSVEDKKNSDSFSYKEYEQIGAETIAFSFLKNKEHKDSDITMIPSISVSGDNIQVHCYDSVKDVFIQSGHISLIEEIEDKRRQLQVPAILLIWLTLNYKLFMTMDDIEVKSGLHQLIDVDKFKREIKAPCHSRGSISREWVADSCWTSTQFVSLRFPQNYKKNVTMKLMSEVKSPE